MSPVSECGCCATAMPQRNRTIEAVNVSLNFIEPQNNRRSFLQTNTGLPKRLKGGHLVRPSPITRRQECRFRTSSLSHLQCYLYALRLRLILCEPIITSGLHFCTRSKQLEAIVEAQPNL